MRTQSWIKTGLLMYLKKLSNSVFAYVIKKLSKLIKKKKKHTLHKQATPDDGLGRVRKYSRQFWEIHLPIPT